jgi:hypothetical protein
MFSDCAVLPTSHRVYPRKYELDVTGLNYKAAKKRGQ